MMLCWRFQALYDIGSHLPYFVLTRIPLGEGVWTLRVSLSSSCACVSVLLGRYPAVCTEYSNAWNVDRAGVWLRRLVISNGLLEPLPDGVYWIRLRLQLFLPYGSISMRLSQSFVDLHIRGWEKSSVRRNNVKLLVCVWQCDRVFILAH